MKNLILMCCVLSLFCNWRKDVAVKSVTDVPQLAPNFFLSADTSCIQAPNVFSPNGDGLNDRPKVVKRNLTSYTMLVKTMTSDTVFFSENGDTTWNGNDPTLTGIQNAPIPYQLTLQATTLSGVVLNGTATVYKVLDIFNHCIGSSVPPICSDQFDPRICGLPYATNDFYCTQ